MESSRRVLHWSKTPKRPLTDGMTDGWTDTGTKHIVNLDRIMQYCPRNRVMTDARLQCSVTAAAFVDVLQASMHDISAVRAGEYALA